MIIKTENQDSIALDIKPRYCSALISNNCLLKCKMCEMWKSVKDERELTNEEWKTVFLKLRNLLNPEAEICFTGGEPLLRTGIIDLISFASEMGFKTGLNTNAYLIDEKMAQAISWSSLWSITISLESLNEKTHDFIRGTPGSYRRIMNAIEYLSKYCDRLYIGISTVILDTNFEDIIDLALWVQSNKKLHSIRFQAMMQPLATPKDTQWHKNDKYNILWPKDIDSVHSVLNRLIQLKEEGGLEKLDNTVAQLKIFQQYFRDPFNLPMMKKCIFSDDVININDIGDVYLCPDIGSIGNVRTEDINKVWYSERVNFVKEQIKECKRSCNFIVNCFWE